MHRANNSQVASCSPNEACHFYEEAQEQVGGAAYQAQDQNAMLYTWTTMIIYLMTDFYYLHE